MRGSKNNISNRGAKQAQDSVLLVWWEGRKMHKRIVHDRSLHEGILKRTSAK